MRLFVHVKRTVAVVSQKGHTIWSFKLFTSKYIYMYGEIGTMLLGTYYSESHKIEGKILSMIK